MKKTTTTANHSPKGRTATAITKTVTKNRTGIYAHGKKLADSIWNVLNYQYKDSDLQFIL